MKCNLLSKIKFIATFILGTALFTLNGGIGLSDATADYCIPEINSVKNYITQFQTLNGVTNISNESGNDNGYGNFYNYHSVSAFAGNSFNFEIGFYSPREEEYGSRIWVDWNNDGVFENSEVVFRSEQWVTGYQGGIIMVPEGIQPGDYRMRINISLFHGAGNPNPCFRFGGWIGDRGEFEDYKLTVLDDADYCRPTGNTSFEYIQSFETADAVTNIQNFSGDSYGYGDYFDSHSVSDYAGESFDFTMTFSNDYYNYGSRIWVDWGNDGSFYEPEDIAFMSDDFAYGAQEGSIKIPPGTPAGEYRMRINMSYSYSSGNPNPCASNSPYGEFEDYKLIVLEGEAPGEFCDWRIRVWGNHNGSGTSWYLKDKNGEVVFSNEGVNTSTIFNYISETENLEEPVTFHLDVNDPDAPGAYRTVNYYVLRNNGKIFHGTVRNEVIHKIIYCTDDDEDGTKPGINSALTDFDFSYYPNPVKDVLYIHSVQNIKEVKVFNIAGQQLTNLNKGLSTNSEINLSTLPKGIYVIRTVLEDGQLETFKIVKR